MDEEMREDESALDWLFDEKEGGREKELMRQRDCVTLF
jgi:hypothetical protein